MEIKIGRSKLHPIQGDITEMEVDAIVNAANPSLMGGGGVDGTIHRKGGPKILEECERLRATKWPEGLPRSKAVITSRGNLRAKYVIHTVGPIWLGGNQAFSICFPQFFETTASKGLKTIAFPSISIGAYGYPIDRASRVALKTIKEF